MIFTVVVCVLRTGRDRPPIAVGAVVAPTLEAQGQGQEAFVPPGARQP